MYNNIAYIKLQIQLQRYKNITLICHREVNYANANYNTT